MSPGLPIIKISCSGIMGQGELPIFVKLLEVVFFELNLCAPPGI
jgi:hypothetical protein